MKNIRRNFLCGLLGREPANLADLNAELRCWVSEVANQRVHGTTHYQVLLRWDEDQFAMQPVNGRLPYPYMDDEQRKVARDAYVAWHGSRYSVPWKYAGKEILVRDYGRDVEVQYSSERIAVHAQAVRPHQIITRSEHHEGIPTGNKQGGKTLIQIQQRYLKTRLQLAHLPNVKTFEQFDFGFQPPIDERQIRELRSLRFVHEASNVILMGPPGVGKTHLAVALAETAIHSGQAAYFLTAHDLVTDLGRD